MGEESDVITALFWGRPGTGKTTLAASFPKPVLVLDVQERGTRSIRNVPDAKKIKIQDFPQFEEVYDYLDLHRKKYQTVVMDTVTAAQRLALEHILEVERGEDMSQRKWGKVGGLLIETIQRFRTLAESGINVIFIAHDRTSHSDYDEGDSSLIDPQVGAMVMPSVASYLNGAVDVIGQCYIREKKIMVKGQRKSNVAKRVVEYAVRVGPHPYYNSKIRRPRMEAGLPQFVSDPTYEKLIQLM